MSFLVRAATVVTGQAVLRPGWVSISGPLITGLGSGSPSGPGLDFPSGTVVPGFIDLHVHGGGGYAYTSDQPGDGVGAAAYHRARGTTSTLASLVTADERTLTRWVRTLGDLVRAAGGPLDGIHLEGPWLNPVRRGAHERQWLRDPDPVELERLLAAGRGAIRMITLAPELPGGLDLVRRIAGAGVIAAIGHTDADYDTTRAAIAAGATVATHLFNAMPPLHHRRPGPIAALLEDSRVTLELIADGVHLHPAMLTLVRAAVGPERVSLVTDAIMATGMPDGPYHLGPHEVTLSAGVARSNSSGTIAGGTATTADLFRAALGSKSRPGPGSGAHGSGAQGSGAQGSGAQGSEVCTAAWLPDDDALLAAVQMTAVTPARTLGLDDAGQLLPGRRADLVALTADFQVDVVLSRGCVVS